MVAVKVQRHKELMEFTELAHAAWGFLGVVVGFSAQPRLLSNVLGKMAAIIHFKRYISHLTQSVMTSSLIEGWN